MVRTMKDKRFCKFCGEEIDKDSIVCPKCGRQLKLKKEEKEKEKENNSAKEVTTNKKEFYKEKWFMWLTLIIFSPVGIFIMWKFHPELKKNVKIILSIVFGIFFLFALTSGNSSNYSNSSSNVDNTNSSEINKTSVEIIDFSSMTKADIDTWCNEKKIKCIYSTDYSNTIAKDKFISQSVESGQSIYEGESVTITYSLGKEPTIEMKNALKKAESYSSLMHMSKKGIYEQLTSEYGEGFDAASAQYAIDNLKADYNANALAKAKSYRDTMSMSKNAIYEQLVSEYGEKFTASEAQYAIDHLDN